MVSKRGARSGLKRREGAEGASGLESLASLVER